MSGAPVLIVGAGPVGQLAALLLARQGIASRLIDRRLTPSAAPKAHAVNPRTLEICESVGVSAEGLRAAGASANDAGWVRFVGTLTGPEFGCLPYERQDDGALAFTPFPLANIPQPVFEAVLSKAIADEPLIDFTRGVACTGLEERGAGVTACLTDVDGASGKIDCDYVVAADGAGSKLRNMLGIPMDGPEALQHNIMIHFEADLTAQTDARPGVLYFLFDLSTSGVLIAFDRAKTWVLMHPYDPEREDSQSFDAVKCRPFVGAAIGADVDFEIRNISPWVMSAQVAALYRKGRVFLAGDAAHRFPPTGGLGLNTGAGDAQNLAWKLAAVLKGEAGEELLDTYEVERRPVALVNSEQSLVNSAKLFDVPAVLYGHDPAGKEAHYAALEKNHATNRMLAEAVEAQRPHFDSFNLQLGYRYASPAILNAPALKSGAETDISLYEPSWEPGACLPHRWVANGKTELSLLSLIDRTRFNILAGPQGHAWRHAAAECSLHALVANEDFTDMKDWTSLTGLPRDGALVIRPDGHIACRFDGSADAAQKLAKTMSILTARRQREDA